jgi:hypothetical protein
MIVNMEHYACGTFTILLKKPLQNMDDEFHRCVVVVQNKHTVEVGLLGLRLGAGNDRGSAVSVVPVPFAVILHPDRFYDHVHSFLDQSGGAWECALPAESLTTNLVHNSAILSPLLHTAITIRPLIAQRHKNSTQLRDDDADKTKRPAADA